MKRVWTDDVVQFRAQLYNISPSKIGPMPIQKLHPPIVVGGSDPNTFHRIINYADGWITAIEIRSLAELEQSIKRLKEAVRKVGRSTSSVRAFVLTYPNVNDGDISETKRPLMTCSI